MRSRSNAVVVPVASAGHAGPWFSDAVPPRRTRGLEQALNRALGHAGTHEVYPWLSPWLRGVR